jgi:hypothetical protein
MLSGFSFSLSFHSLLLLPLLILDCCHPADVAHQQLITTVLLQSLLLTDWENLLSIASIAVGLMT